MMCFVLIIQVLCASHCKMNRTNESCDELIARFRLASQFQKLSFNNLLASLLAEGELLIVSCRLSPAVPGRLAAGGP